MKLYEYRILYIPLNEDDEVPKEKPKVLANGELFAKDQKEVDLRCARMIPEEYVDRLDEVMVATRPF